MASSHWKYVIVAAFDFGTTYSGYAYSFRDAPSLVQANQPWLDDTSNIKTTKAPTCVLLTPDREFHSFGYDAEKMYLKLVRENMHEGWLLFRRFKMLLHNNETLTRQTTVTDINGVSMPAVTIFTMAIRYLRDQLLQSIDFSGGFYTEQDIEYVLTVPAIWNERSRMFMREAAVEAGVSDRRLRLCKEPDAAGIYCQCAKTLFPDPKDPKKETPYMVLDLGGGTADIYIHEKNQDNTIRELYRASGGPWGGVLVDKAFLDFLNKVFGQHNMDTFKKEHMVDYFDLLRDFENIKRTVEPDTQGFIQFSIPGPLRNMVPDTDVQKQAENITEKGRVRYDGENLEVEAIVVKDWFALPVSNVIDHILETLEKPELNHVENILLVGGFGESKLVQQELKNRLRKNIVIPEEPSLTVLKGAVRYGQLPEIVKYKSVIST